MDEARAKGESVIGRSRSPGAVADFSTREERPEEHDQGRRSHERNRLPSARQPGGLGRTRESRERLEIEDQIASGLKTLVGIFLETMLDEPYQSRRNLLVFERRGIGFQDLVHRLGGRGMMESGLV
jgi:hypothetical protein